MNIISKLNDLNLEDDAVVNFTFSEGVDVFVHNETEVETALTETSVVETFCELISQSGLQVYPSWGSATIIDDLRDEGLLDDYERDFTFPEYLTNIINENFYNLELIEYTIEKFDHKRGFCTLTADVNIPLSSLIETNPYISSAWTVTVKTPNGQLTLS
tara:strand:- start:115 stop:591 length:477 start_codon:yes stop_codon:yes gene_type:complete